MITVDVFTNKHSSIEMNYIKQYLNARGHRICDLANLPAEQARQLMVEASSYASLKLAELEAKADFRQKIKIS